MLKQSINTIIQDKFNFDKLFDIDTEQIVTNIIEVVQFLNNVVVISEKWKYNKQK